MMLWSALLVLLCFEWSLAEVRLSDKEASLICVYNGELDTYDMHFRVKLNTDPTGNMRAIENTDYYENPKAFTPVTCTRNYDGATKIYTVDSRVDPNGNNDDNLCGMTEKTVTVGSTTERTYEFLFMHNIDITGDKDLMVSDKDRVYIARCSPSTSVNNVVTSSLTVTNSNLNAQLTPASIPVTMSIYRKLVPSVLLTRVSVNTTLQCNCNSPYTCKCQIYTAVQLQFSLHV
ncbi:hypothetical protein MAR_038119 [Mya arenaria]|uniref:Uncharacterized protein n=1 Tax=Mya arenaria TaxID=6604 RepID=A0ABY7FQZ8_MYAAR|nr:hypothetical protein MAR_038119 [Mya arenaria]